MKVEGYQRLSKEVSDKLAQLLEEEK